MAKNNKPIIKDNNERAKEDLIGSSLEDSIEIGFGSGEKAERIGDLDEKELKQLREKIEQSDLGADQDAKALAQASSMKFLQDDQKIKKLLGLARKKGIIYAVGVAKKLNDPYLLDTLHDKLAENGLYKDFIK